MRQSSDVADLETVYLPVAAQHTDRELDTLIDVTAALFIPARNTPRETCVASFVSSTPPLIGASPARREALQDFYPRDNTIGVTSDIYHLYTMQTLCPTPSLLDTLITIEHLCKLFLLQRGSLPLEISLHWLVCLELMAYGHSSFCFALDNDSGAFSQPVRNIPFVASLTESEHMIVVRGR